MRSILTVVILSANLCSVSCKTAKDEPSELEGNDSSADYFYTADQLRRDPKIFLDDRARAGRPVPVGQDNLSFNLAQIKELNDMNTADNNLLADDDRDEERKATISKGEADELYRIVASHPVASLAVTHKYDPNNSGTGFCFGRAMTAHLEALFNMKVKNSSIRKLFAMGKLQTGSKTWGWHVTAIIKAKEGGWWAIDPVRGSVVSAENWYKWMLDSLNPSKDLVLLHDRAMRLGPTASKYTLQQVNMQDYHDYFKDLLNVYKTKFRAKKD